MENKAQRMLLTLRDIIEQWEKEQISDLAAVIATEDVVRSYYDTDVELGEA